MDCTSSSTPAQDGYEDPPTPPRSPSRLDFCIQDSEDDDDDDSPMMDWSTVPFLDDYPYTFVDQDPFAVDTSPLDSTRPLIAEGDALQATHCHDNINIPPPFFAPPGDQMDQVTIEPRAPIPVRLPSVQNHVEDEESTPPSHAAIQRLNYPHRGFSRSALLQQKTFWSSRHDEWAERDKPQRSASDTSDAYTGLATPRRRSPPPYMRAPPSGLERDLTDRPTRSRRKDAQVSIYPRVGDISALRDPYSVNIDRCFCKFPLWTLCKTLYAFDMQKRSRSLAPSMSAFDAGQIQVSVSASTLSSYSSEDEESDSTLVADSPVSKAQLPVDPLNATSSPRSPSPWVCFRGWEHSWYARWELLISLFRNRTNLHALDVPTKSQSPFEYEPGSSSSPERLFRFAIEQDEDGNDDEAEGCSVLVTDPCFSVDFDEECERALAFYRRELTCLDAASL